MRNELIFCLVCLINIVAFNLVQSASDNVVESCKDEKEFKNLLKTRPNLLILFSKADSEVREIFKLLKEVNLAVKGKATVGYVNCEVNKKVCKKYKVNPNPFELKHFMDGAFNKDYDRSLTKKSFINFLNDPKGDMPWDEEQDAKDVVHLKDANALNKLLKKPKVGILVMFYAPWCGFCKKLKPDYSSAATQLKSIGGSILAAINVDTAENFNLKTQYNITGFPTILFFKNGNVVFPYGGEFTKDSLVEWMQNPAPPKPKEEEANWAEEDDMHVTFLTDDTFDSFLETHNNVLVKFYAPWCGHCKNMKPVFNNVARQLIEEESPNVIAFVDATRQRGLAERFKLKGFPTIKFFKDGKFAWDYQERDEQKILEFMRNPVQPPPKQEEPEWKDEKTDVIHAEASNFASILKTKKHALVMFYAPWCGHCKSAKPQIVQAAEHFRDDIKVAFIGLDCTKHQSVCEQYNVKGFPTILYFNFGKNPKPYEGERQAKNFIAFMSNPNDPNAGKSDPREEWLQISGNEHIQFLDDSNFDEVINTKPKVLVMFYAPWCGHCKAMKPAFGQAATDLKRFLPGSYLGAVDATKAAGLSTRFQLQGFPTLKYFENGKFKFDYEGGREKDDLVNFMRNPIQSSPKQEL